MCRTGWNDRLIPSLPLFHTIAGQKVIVLGSGDVAEARRRLVERAGGIVVTDIEQGIAQGARMAFIAYQDVGAAEAEAKRLRAAGLLVNTADRPELCDFTVPSILDRSPVLLAVGTGGASAGLAKALRLRLEALLPASLGRLASALAAARDELRTRWSDAGERRRALDAALGEGGELDPLREGAADRLELWLLGAAPGETSRTVEIRLVSADPEDLTLRHARALGSADAVVHEEGVPAAILDRARADAARIGIAPGEAAPEISGLVVVLRY
jgi:uroporphyrin-III C-methyltransferase / precorrin-2 dehydrogenase / sirohydrochlorin ferrochelatase